MENRTSIIIYQKVRYQENPKIHRKYQKKRYLKYQEKKTCDKDEYFLQQVKQGLSCIICTMFSWTLYQRSVRLFKHQKHHIVTAELYHLVKSFNEKFCICGTCHKHLNKNEIPFQAVCNKMALNSILSYPISYKKS